jgi:hypothetical protein
VVEVESPFDVLLLEDWSGVVFPMVVLSSGSNLPYISFIKELWERAVYISNISGGL